MFFEKLLTKNPFSPSTLKKMHEMYELSLIKNAEVKSRWFQLALSGSYLDVIDEIVDFVTSVGRMKFVRPIYKYFSYLTLRALNKVDSKKAKETFKAHEFFYHPICANMIRKDLGII